MICEHQKEKRRCGMLWVHPVITLTQSGLGLLVSGSSAQLPPALNRLPESLAASEWTFEHINLVAGRRGAVVEDYFYNKLEWFSVHWQAGKKDKILVVHVQRKCEAHDTVIQFYYQQIYGSSGADATTSMENLREQASVYVNNSHSLCHQLPEQGEDGALKA